MGSAPCIGLVQEAFGRNAAESWLEIQLHNLSEFAGCKEKLTTEHITELSQMILGSYAHYKLTEFMLFFQRFKRCEYGKFYGAVDPMVILQALSTFDEERRREIDEIKHRQWKEQQQIESEAEERLRARYIARIPRANTDEAPLSFLQYRLLDYDTVPDDALAKELELITSGRKELPATGFELLQYRQQQTTHNNNDTNRTN